VNKRHESVTTDVDPRAAGERPLSLSYYTVPELNPLETVSVAAACGCRYVGLRLLGGQPGNSETDLLKDAALRRQMIRALAAAGVSALDANTVRLVPATVAAAYLPFFDAAAELGARHVLATVDDAESTRRLDNLAQLCEIAAARDLSIDFEFVPWLQLANLEQAARLVEQCASPVPGISIDALHFYRSNSQPQQIADLPASWFRYAQICDVATRAPPPTREAFIREATEERLPPGEGVIDLGALLRALPPRIPLALEIPQLGLARSAPALDRVKHAVAATRHLLQQAGCA